MDTMNSRSRSKWFKCNYIIWISLMTVLLIDITMHVHNNLEKNNCETSNTESHFKNSPDNSNVIISDGNFGQKSIDCDIGSPCLYPEVVDLRIIVMTYNRDSALMKLLQSLDDLVFDASETSALEIWIDRSKEDKVHDDTVRVAEAYVWLKGVKRVHIQKRHVGIYGQWIETWRPRANTRELALFLEDDLIISPYAWRWLKAVHKKYGKYPDCLGYTLQSERVINAVGGASFDRPAEDVIFMYQMVGSWGFIPHPTVWTKFQDWFYEIRKDTSFHPYVNDILMTMWYKKFEKSGSQDSMWTMWFIYYINENKLYGVYNNLNHIASTKNHSLAIHREEPGLHYFGKPRKGVDSLLLTKWSNNYIEFPEKVKKYGFDGKERNLE